MSRMATLNVSVQPRRLLSTADAAAYCNLPLNVFRKVCPVAPVALTTGRQAFDMRDLDAWIDGSKNSAVDSDDALLDRLK